MIKKIIKKKIYIYIYIKVLKKRAKFVPPQSLRLKKKMENAELGGQRRWIIMYEKKLKRKFLYTSAKIVTFKLIKLF